MKNWLDNREFLRSVSVPTNTRTYTAIPHSVLLDEVTAEVENRGYTIAEERYLPSRDGEMFVGNIRLSGGNATMGPTITVVNSYNKTKKASIKVMAMILVCKNGMMRSTTQGSFVRKHNGDALNEFRNHLNEVVGSIDQEFKRLERCMEEMKSRPVSKEVVSQLIGDMYLNEALINTTQMEIIKKELRYSENFKDGSLWSLYNNCTAGFHDSHPTTYDKQHIKFHTYITDKFGLEGSRGLYGAKIEEAQLIEA